MTRRSAVSGSGEAAYQRLAQRMEENQAAANERFEGALDTMLHEVRELRKDVQKLDGKHDRIDSRVFDLEQQIITTRDEVQRRALIPAPSQIESAKTAIKSAAKSWPAQVAAGCLFFTTLVVALNNIPDAIRWWDRTVVILRGAEHPAAQVDAKAGSK